MNPALPNPGYLDSWNDRTPIIIRSGGPTDLERTIGETIECSIKNQLVNLIDKLSFPLLIALLKRADVVLTPDSGPAHLANVVGTPVIGLHACTWPRRSGPYNLQDLCVDKFVEAAQQFRNKNPEDLRWGTRIKEEGVMKLIEVDDVINRLDLAIKRLDAG